MSKEVHLQIDLFTQELVDTRTQKQKKHAVAQTKPQQTAMFSQRELAQFGVQANPKLPLSPKTRLELVMEDRRTEEEKIRQLRAEIEKQMVPMPWMVEDAEV